MWKANASPSIAFIPMRSQRLPPIKMAIVNPQKASPTIQPSCVLVSAKCSLRSPRMSPLTAKMTAVEINATQLARNSR